MIVFPRVLLSSFYTYQYKLTVVLIYNNYEFVDNVTDILIDIL